MLTRTATEVVSYPRAEVLSFKKKKLLKKNFKLIQTLLAILSLDYILFYQSINFVLTLEENSFQNKSLESHCEVIRLQKIDSCLFKSFDWNRLFDV